MYLHFSSNIIYSFGFKCQLNTLSVDIMNMQMSFSVAEIGCSKTKNLIFYGIFLNTDISITTQEIATKICMTILHINCEGSVSQMFYLGPSFYFMLSRKLSFENIKKVNRFLL